MANSAWSVLVGVELDTSASKIKSQLDKQLKDVTFKVGVEGTDKASQNLAKVSDSAEYMGLTFQEANLIMQRSLEVISSMVEQVYNLDGAITEFKKVSDLSGKSLDDYVAKLTLTGQEVARTGKPKCLARKVRMVNVL